MSTDELKEQTITGWMQRASNKDLALLCDKLAQEILDRGVSGAVSLVKVGNELRHRTDPVNPTSRIYHGLAAK